jgi:ABC-type Fe3+-hydroxamate transport system substrate-binding protein
MARRAAVLAASVALLAGCRGGAARPAGPRVVSLHDVTTEIAVALGAADRLVGASEPVQLPEAVRAALGRVPRAEGAESIVALRPTVVLGTAVVAQRSPELVRFLEQRGIEVFLAQPHTLDDVLALVTAVGARLGERPAAEALAGRLRERLGAETPGEPLPVFVHDCCDPPFTAGGGAVLTDIIRRAGGRNVFDDLKADWTKVSWEAVLARRPELIVIHDYEYEGQSGVEGKRRQLAALKGLAAAPVVVLPLGYSLGGLRSFDGLDRLREAVRAARRPR